VTAGWLDALDEVLYDIDEALLASAELRLAVAMAALRERSSAAEPVGDGRATGNRLVRT
jgi:hypothetical protein